jgi:hypothetical protein
MSINKSNWHGGKGSKRRNSNESAYADNWEKIFGKKKPEIKARKTQPEHSKTQIHKDKSKQLPRKYKYNHIEDSIST